MRRRPIAVAALGSSTRRPINAFLLVAVILSAGFACLIGGVGCGGKKQAAETVTKKLVIYNWPEYIGKSTIYLFQKETGAEVEYNTYASNEELLATIQSADNAADIIFPSDYMVRRMLEQKLLSPLDHSKISNINNIDDRFRSTPYDPNNKYCVPYTWGTTGLGINTYRVKEPVKSWKILWDPKYKGRISVLDDPRAGMIPALKMLGLSINTTDPEELKRAAELMRRQKSVTGAYSSDQYDQLLMNGDVWIAQGYSGDIVKVSKREHNIVYVLPEEGSDIWVDNICMTKKSKNRALAHKFIDFILRPEVHALVSNELGYAVPNIEAKKLVKPEVLSNPSIFPPYDFVSRCNFIDDLGEFDEEYETAWDEIKLKPALPLRAEPTPTPEKLAAKPILPAELSGSSSAEQAPSQATTTSSSSSATPPTDSAATPE